MAFKGKHSVIEASFIPSLHGRAAHTGGKLTIPCVVRKKAGSFYGAGELVRVNDE